MKDTAWLKETVFCHRGLHNNRDIPENSIAAFRRACDQGLGSELDVYLTRDGKLIVHHDATLKRMCNMNISPYRIDTSHLENYRLLQSDQSIPLFSDVLDACGEKGKLIVEIKTTTRVDETCRSVWELLKNYKGRYCIESFNALITNWWVRNHPEVIIGQLYDTYALQYVPLKLGRQYRKMDFLAVPVLDLPSAYYSKVRRENPDKMIITWTVRTAENLQTARENADNIIFECNDKNPAYITTDDARSFL